MTTLIKQRKPDPGEVLMGLENIGYTLFPECQTTLEIPMIKRKFNLGLSDEEKKAFENYFNVQFDTPEGYEFLSNYRIELRHDVNPKDHNKMEHLFDLAILKANGGMGVVQFEDDEDFFGKRPFIATNEEKEIKDEVGKKQTRNKAIKSLEELAKKKTSLIKYAKYIFDLGAAEISEDIAYKRLDDYIMGGQADKFLNIMSLDPDYVDTVVTVKDAITHGIIRLGQDQWYSNYANQTKLGRNLEEIVNYLNNPNNQDQLGLGSKDDLPYAIKRQLKEKI